jgi:hypothetical protein
MNPIELLLAAEAAETGRAQPRRLVRHVQLEPAPLAIAVVQMAGEAHSLWGALVGRDPDAPRLFVAPEPRNRDIEYGTFSRFGKLLCEEMRAATDATRAEIRTKKGVFTRCTRAPQLLVANAGVAELLGRLGRRMRPAGYKSTVPVPAFINETGAHLGFYAEMARAPGSSLLVIATEQLARHKVTGQSSLENAHLGAQLAWWDPAFVDELVPGLLGEQDPASLHGADAAKIIERVPMGSLTDPAEDNSSLIEAVTRFNKSRKGATDLPTVVKYGAEVAGLLRAALMPVWRGLWVAHRELSALPPAPSVSARWEQDLHHFTGHVDYIRGGGRRASVDSARRATILLADYERAQAALERDEVLEDPLGLAGAIAAGQAIQGSIESVDLTHQELGPSGTRMVKRPLVTMLLDAPCPFPRGTDLWWVERPGAVCTEVQSSSVQPNGFTRVVLKVKGGMNGQLPLAGSTTTFSTYSSGFMPSAELPDDTPWTHTPAPGAVGDTSVDLDQGPSIDEALELSAPGGAT